MIAASKTAYFYDAIARAAGRDVERETATVTRIVRERVTTASERPAMLVVRCGTGAYLELFAEAFDVDGFDGDPLMVQLARSRVPEANVWLATFDDFAPPRAYAAIVALDSALSYARTLDRLGRIVHRLADGLAPGGALIAEPYLAPDVYETGRIESVAVHEPRLEIARMAVTARVANIALIDYHSLAASNMGVERHFARHERGLFTAAQYRGAFENAGLQAESIDDVAFRRGLYRGLVTG